MASSGLGRGGQRQPPEPSVQARNIGYALECLRHGSPLECARFLFSGSQAEYGIVGRRNGEEIAYAILCLNTERIS